MGKDFLNERLITTRRFAPGSASGTAADAGDENRPAPDSENAESRDAREHLESIRKREEKTLRGEALRQEAAEVVRRRHAAEEQVTVAITELETVRDRTKKRLEALEEARGRLAALPRIQPDRMDDAALREARSVVGAVHVELARQQKERRETAASRSGVPELTSLSFSQLTRLGLGLTWPLLVVGLVAAAIVAGALLAVFRV